MIRVATLEELREVADSSGVGYHELSVEGLRQKLLLEGQ